MRNQSYRAFVCAQSDFVLRLRSTYLLTKYRCSERKELSLVEEIHCIAAKILRVYADVSTARDVRIGMPRKLCYRFRWYVHK